MKKKIRAKLESCGLFGVQEKRADASFVDTCVLEILEHKSYSVKDLAKIFRKSEDWVLDHFKDVTGMFKQGNTILYPQEAVKAKIRSMLTL